MKEEVSNIQSQLSFSPAELLQSFSKRVQVVEKSRESPQPRPVDRVLGPAGGGREVRRASLRQRR